MDDNTILAHYFARDEQAIVMTQQAYGRLCHRVAMDILGQEQDAEECVNDTYLQAWNSIPPARPEPLSTYLCCITRNLAFNRRRDERREKRGGGQTALALDELAEVLPGECGDVLDDIALRDALTRFLTHLPRRTRQIFILRYWYFRPVADIAADLRMGESRIKMILLRTRRQLARHLEDEGCAYL